MGIADYSTNPDNNGVVGGVPYFPPGMLANALDNAARQVMADLAAFYANALLKKLQNSSTILDTLATPTERGIGYRDLPFAAAKTAAYTFALADVGTIVPVSTGGTTIPANSSVAFPVGSIVLMLNNGSSPQNITGATGVILTLAATTTTGTRTIAVNGIATMLKSGTDSWLVYGVGVS